MAALEFTHKDGKWVANTTVNSDYALHVERSEEGLFLMNQRSVNDGNYANCEIPYIIQAGRWKVMDKVFVHGYYPMHLEIISYSEVTKAEINEVQNG